MRSELHYPPTLVLFTVLVAVLLYAVLRLLRSERPLAAGGAAASPRTGTPSTATVAVVASSTSAGWQDRRILSPDDAPFGRLAPALEGQGFQLQAQGPGDDPELASYTRNEVRVAYRSDTMLGLRTLEVKDPAGQAAQLAEELVTAARLRTIDRSALADDLRSDEPTRLLRALEALDWLTGGAAATAPGLLTAAELERVTALAGHDRSDVAARAARLLPATP